MAHTVLILPGWRNLAPGTWPKPLEAAWLYPCSSTTGCNLCVATGWCNWKRLCCCPHPVILVALQPGLHAHRLPWPHNFTTRHRVRRCRLLVAHLATLSVKNCAPCSKAGRPSCCSLPFASVLLGSQDDSLLQLPGAWPLPNWGSRFIDYVREPSPTPAWAVAQDYVAGTDIRIPRPGCHRQVRLFVGVVVGALVRWC